MLQVTMDDALRMDVPDSSEKLCHDLAGLGFGDAGVFLFGLPTVKAPTSRQIGDEVDLFVLVEFLDHVGDVLAAVAARVSHALRDAEGLGILLVLAGVELLDHNHLLRDSMLCVHDRVIEFAADLFVDFVLVQHISETLTFKDNLAQGLCFLQGLEENTSIASVANCQFHWVKEPV